MSDPSIVQNCMMFENAHTRIPVAILAQVLRAEGTGLRPVDERSRAEGTECGGRMAISGRDGYDSPGSERSAGSEITLCAPSTILPSASSIPTGIMPNSIVPYAVQVQGGQLVPLSHFTCCKCGQTMPVEKLSSRKNVCIADNSSYRSLAVRLARCKAVMARWQALLSDQQRDWLLRNQQLRGTYCHEFRELVQLRAHQLKLLVALCCFLGHG